MKKISLYLVLCVVVFTTGCPKYKPDQVDFNNSNSFVRKLNAYFADQQTKYRAALNSVPDGPLKAQAIRNEFLEDVLPYIDERYMDFITDIQRGRDRDNFVADLVELGASAAVGITNGERPLQILGIALTAFRGGRRSADLNFYKEQTTPVLINKMDGNRAKVRARILTREKEGVNTYPIGAAISDIVDYYNAGTLVRAFTELQKDTAVDTRQAENNLLELKGVRLTTPSTQTTTNEANAVLPILESISNALASSVQADKDAALKRLQNIYAALEQDDEIDKLLKVAELSSKDTDGAKLLKGLMSMKRKLATDSEIQSKINRAIIDHGK